MDRIFPQRDIVAMKTNNVASYSDVLVTCMRQNPKWILLSEVRSAEAVSAVRNSISSGHNILSTIHADKASAIPYRLYSLMETDLDVHQFLSTIYRYIQLGVHIKAFYSKEYGKFHRELDEVCEFFVDDDNVPRSRIIYQKVFGKPMMCKPSDHLIEYLENQNIQVQDIIHGLPQDLPIHEVLDEEGSKEETEEKVESAPAPAASAAPVPVASTAPEPVVSSIPAAPTPEVSATPQEEAAVPQMIASTPVSQPAATPVAVSVQPAVVSVQQTTPATAVANHANLTKLEE